MYLQDGRVFRGLSAHALESFGRLEESAFYRRHLEAGRIVGTRRLAHDANPLPDAVQSKWQGFLEHDRVAAISYPYEWTFSMLRNAALLQLRLQADALQEDFTLKDATPYNIQFTRNGPVFIDVPSFEPLEPGEAWSAYRQFCEMFLFPLMLQAHKGMDFQPFMRASIDGVGVQTAARIFSGGHWFSKGVLSHVRMQAALERRYSGRQVDVKQTLKSAGFSKELIIANVKKLRRLVERLEWRKVETEWADYTEFHNYSDADHRGKEDFVRRCVEAVRPGRTWDVGANTGQFSAIAAAHSRQVLAIDVDHQAVERMYLDSERPANVLPLLQNLLDPSPNRGWRNLERSDLASRCPPDLVLCLAVIHHAVITGNVPLAEFVEWLASLAPELVIEYVSREDDKVQRLLQNKKDIYWDYHREHLEQQLALHFDIREQTSLSSGRRHLYWCSRRTGA